MRVETFKVKLQDPGFDVANTRYLLHACFGLTDDAEFEGDEALVFAMSIIDRLKKERGKESAVDSLTHSLVDLIGYLDQDFISLRKLGLDWIHEPSADRRCVVRAIQYLGQLR